MKTKYLDNWDVKTQSAQCVKATIPQPCFTV